LSEDAKDILDSDTNMGIRLQITSSLVSYKSYQNLYIKEW